jgi:tryptophan 2,3-dioxygenase
MNWVMPQKQISANILDRIEKLEEKFEAMGQDLASYLDGLLYADYLKYWEYIHLDTLLSLQHPKTAFPDESIFIIYHQITELYFKLIIKEIDQAIDISTADNTEMLMRLKRINNYISHLSNSFSIMELGMEREQFLKFRMALLPASGFQSAQYRIIELKCTDLVNLLKEDDRAKIKGDETQEELLDVIYWKSGATELSTGKKTLTLKHFEEKYSETFLKLTEKHKANNLLRVWQNHCKDGAEADKIKNELRKLDSLLNIHWRLAHYKSAVKYLQRDPVDIAATGGTNWQKYLPPMFQRIIFFPELWNEQEREEWGKAWVLEQLGIPKP